MIGLGIPEGDAQWYVAEVEAGRVVVAVRGENGDHARDILERYGGMRRPRAEAATDALSDETAIPGNAVPATPY